MKKNVYFSFISILLILGSTPYSLFSQKISLNNHEFIFSGGYRPDIASFNDGRYVICRESGMHVFAQIFDKNGTMLTPKVQTRLPIRRELYC